jgi:hypothetical protein
MVGLCKALLRRHFPRTRYSSFYFSIKTDKLIGDFDFCLFSMALGLSLSALYRVQQTRPSISLVVTHSVPWLCILPPLVFVWSGDGHIVGDPSS